MGSSLTSFRRLGCARIVYDPSAGILLQLTVLVASASSILRIAAAASAFVSLWMIDSSRRSYHEVIASTVGESDALLKSSNCGGIAGLEGV